MKKLSKILALILSVVCLLSFTACGKEPERVVITATSSEYDIEGKTLNEFMAMLSDDGKLTYEVRDGLMTSINGIANTTNSYWMLYTDDEENSNTAWGTVEHEGRTYVSASLGVMELVVKDGATYIWVYQTF